MKIWVVEYWNLVEWLPLESNFYSNRKAARIARSDAKYACMGLPGLKLRVRAYERVENSK